MWAKVAIFLFLLVLATANNQLREEAEETINLTIADGEIRGLVNTTVRRGVTYYNFRGIPFAEPPVGNLRFRSPVKNSPWNTTYDATYDRDECVQYKGINVLGGTVYGKEDCLYINVYTPSLSNGSLPVLVWIHGGGFLGGNSSYEQSGPDHFLEQGLVFVSFNYRLGVLGFLSTEDESCLGNWGIKDQVLALQWVQQNIAYFGGNASNVTIFGESAGAASVHLLMQTNVTKGLFHRAIMNSGTSLNLWSLNTRAEKTARLIGLNLGIITISHARLVEKLRKVEISKLQSVAWRTARSLFLGNALRGLPFGPVMEPDVEGALYINPSEYALRRGQFQHVPVLLGFNSNEAVAADEIPALLKFYALYYDLAIAVFTPYSMTSNDITRVIAGNDIKFHYFGLGGVFLSESKLDDFISADHFNRPIRKAAANMANYTTVYFYEFGYEGQISGVVDRSTPGVGHAEDLSYFFRSYNNYTETDIQISERLVLLWSNFAKYGNPTPSVDPQLNNVIWNAVDPSSSDFNYMSLNESFVESVNPKQEDWIYYERLWEEYGDDSEYTTY